MGIVGYDAINTTDINMLLHLADDEMYCCKQSINKCLKKEVTLQSHLFITRLNFFQQVQPKHPSWAAADQAI